MKILNHILDWTGFVRAADSSPEVKKRNSIVRVRIVPAAFVREKFSENEKVPTAIVHTDFVKVSRAYVRALELWPNLVERNCTATPRKHDTEMMRRTFGEVKSRILNSTGREFMTVSYAKGTDAVNVTTASEYGQA